MAELNMEALTRSLQQRVSEAVSKAVDEHLVRQAIALAQLEEWMKTRSEDQGFYDVTRIDLEEFEVALFLPAHEAEHGNDGDHVRKGTGATLAEAVDEALAYLEPKPECDSGCQPDWHKDGCAIYGASS